MCYCNCAYEYYGGDGCRFTDKGMRPCEVEQLKEYVKKFSNRSVKTGRSAKLRVNTFNSKDWRV